jgi:translation initiation factor IF-3
LSKAPRINNQITAPELRVIDENGENLGVLTRDVAFKTAQERGLDIIEVSAEARPPVCRIMEYGKYLYQEQKKNRAIRAGHKTETKTLQVKIGTGEHDLDRKSQKASEFLKEGHRVKIDLYLAGRAKYLDQNFLKERLERILTRISEPYSIAEGPDKGPKGLSVVIARSKK